MRSKQTHSTGCALKVFRAIFSFPAGFASIALNPSLIALALSLLLSLSLALPPALASALDTPGTRNGDEGGSPLKGKVVEIGITLNDVRDARLSVSRVRKATADLYDEVTRQEVSFTYNPNLIGTTVIMTPVPSMSGPYLPARKKWIDLSMAEIGPIIQLFKEDVDAAMESDRRTDVSETARKLLNPLRDSAFTLVGESFSIYKELQGLTSAREYDNRSIAAATRALDKKMKQLDSVLKKSLSILGKEARAASKSKR